MSHAADACPETWHVLRRVRLSQDTCVSCDIRRCFETLSGLLHEYPTETGELQGHFSRKCNEIVGSQIELETSPKAAKEANKKNKKNSFNFRIPEGLQSRAFQKRTQIEINTDSQFMICGNPEMIKETTEVLKSFGLNKNRRAKPGNITVERYWV